MRILRKHSATLIRGATGGGYNEDGEWEEDSSPETKTIRCCIQPDLNGAQRKYKPDMVHEKDCLVVYTEEELIGASEANGTDPDKLTIRGQNYVVLEKQIWNGASRINAWMVICAREDVL
jgi:hypothetical protein